jgi:hypothetical protein
MNKISTGVSIKGDPPKMKIMLKKKFSTFQNIAENWRTPRTMPSALSNETNINPKFSISAPLQEKSGKTSVFF